MLIRYSNRFIILSRGTCHEGGTGAHFKENTSSMCVGWGMRVREGSGTGDLRAHEALTSKSMVVEAGREDQTQSGNS